MIKIIHAADLHLDSPFSGLSPLAAAQRRQEQRELLDRLADLVSREQAQLVLLAGDLLDGDRVYPETVQALAQVLGSLPARVFIAPGNHDPYGPASPYAGLVWPDNVHIFTSPHIQSVPLPELGCAVYGAAFTQPDRDSFPLADFRAPEDGQVHLMVLHGNTQGANYAPILPAQIAASGLDYLALGHIHQPSGLQRAGFTWWAYPGCPEGRGFDETGERGALVVEAAPGQVRARFAPLCRRRYEICTVDLTDAADPLAAICAALPEHTQQDIYRILLTGQSELDPDGVRQLETALLPRFYGLELRCRTRAPQDLWARMGEDSLTGLFLQAMAAQPEDEVRELAVRFGLAALEQREDVAP